MKGKNGIILIVYRCSVSPLTKADQLFCTINRMDRTQTHTRYQSSNSEQLVVNGKLFNVIQKRNISAKEKLKKIKKLLGKKTST